MLKKILTLIITCSILAACSLWSSSSSKPAPNDPTVGSKDSSDMLFGQSAIEPSEQKPKKANTQGSQK
jgi:hypothetical protein